MRFINYNNNNGTINSLLNILESDLSFYEKEGTSFLCISSLSADIDLRNNIISGGSIYTLPDFPISYDTLSYNVSSTDYISFSGIPDNSEFNIYKSNTEELSTTDFSEITSGIVDDNLLEISFDTDGFYKLKFECDYFNTLTTTFIITAI